ncbi:Aldehyde dehydrogenase, dimeric NADP-preferring [Neolecta irregularis DAH-3]|uniref:Aldehyde dehydrogenase n=1 Tax=Neolecta irregularis (strain DAH-3) TaxID=1198029 RepID=A0A1U7LK34_NEOID|nr:Aldehyde dehydrogenase, dimeric NADP-preferring [Neolecta irregularis DAH-3]|eukprot:OLL22953.1 Aldehyde dehydrogenase, dimeric NADP-preferring [Neolecta irregularis DAH-3]
MLRLQRLAADFAKPAFEAYVTEISLVTEEILFAIKHMYAWARDHSEASTAPWIYKLNNPHIRKEPLGTVLIIGPWNYPFHLIMLPFIGAIAAGNTVLLKPSELAPHTAAVITAILDQCLDSSCYKTINGPVPQTTALLSHPFAKIMYTGNATVGKIVMAAAAKHLTPVILELGGKSPAIVTCSADIKLAAKRIAWGKCLNGAQTCVAPDYILIDKSVQDEFIAEFKKAVESFYPNGSCEDGVFARIISDRHFERLEGLLNGSSGQIVFGGNVDSSTRYISPTLVKDCSPDEEIFGPILPMVTTSSTLDAISFVNKWHKCPLALYAFTSDKHEAAIILDNVTSGGATINDTMMHLAVVGLAFGGVGDSGFGAYRGKCSFDAFTHHRTIFVQKGRFIEKLLQVRYPPYTLSKLSLWKRMSDTKPWFDRAGNEYSLLKRFCKILGF